MKRFNVSKAFVAVNGLSSDAGLTTPDIDEADVKRAMLSSAVERFVLTDHTKFNRVAMCRIAPISMVDTIITDHEVNPDVLTQFDADGSLLMQGLQSKPYLIKPNIHELESALGRSLSSSHEITEAAVELILQYDIAYVLVSMGGDGSILVTRDQALFAAPLPANVKGTVGAGDSMLAGFIYGLE